MLIAWILLATGLVFVSSEPQSKDYLPPKGGKRGGDEANEPANYNYSYEVQDPSISLDFGHKEKRLNDLATGTYHVLLPDGRTQIVDYEAGPDGYKPMVRYEGTAIQDDGGQGYNYNAASNQSPVRQPAPPSLQAKLAGKQTTNE